MNGTPVTTAKPLLQARFEFREALLAYRASLAAEVASIETLITQVRGEDVVVEPGRQASPPTVRASTAARLPAPRRKALPGAAKKAVNKGRLVACVERPGRLLTLNEAAELAGVMKDSLRNMLSPTGQARSGGKCNGFHFRWAEDGEGGVASGGVEFPGRAGAGVGDTAGEGSSGRGGEAEQSAAARVA